MHRARFWQERAFKEVTTKQFLSHQWQVRQSVTNVRKLEQFLRQNVQAHESFTEQALQGVKASRMAVRLTPYVLSRMDWQNPEQCAIRKQFIPLAHETSLDHPLLTIDSLHEQESSPVPGLVHRYHDKALFLALSLCPVYCRFCTRSYGVGTTTETQDKSRDLVASRKRWQAVFEYIQQTPHLKDIVVSGGDCYQLTPGQLLVIKDALLAIPHIKRIRIATKGLAVSPSRIVEPEEQQDGWTEAVIQFAQEGRALGKHVALHTHFNHPQEISWISEDASQKFFQAGVTVRNQTVLLRGVNDDAEVMSELITRCADMQVNPYYVYQHDMISGSDALRTPLSDILALERETRNLVAGFLTPQFIVDLPGGGGKRLATSSDTYDRDTGLSTWSSPAVRRGHTFLYADPLHALSDEMQQRWLDKTSRAALLAPFLRE